MGHNARILDQFTRQAQPFAQAQSILNEDVLARILEASECGPSDTALDVACGPGVVVCALAGNARHATGIDLTPAMLDQARKRQAELGLPNVKWDIGDVTRLPYADGQFDIVTCRYAFHHFEQPLLVLKEMARVCRGGGRLVVADCCPRAECAQAYDAVEKLRDPSHTHAMPPEELAALFIAAGISEPAHQNLRLPNDLDTLLEHSFPNKEDVPRIRASYEKAIESDFLDMAPELRHGKIYFSFPISIFSARKVE